MQNIDFLPPRYREQTVARKSSLWHLIVFVLFGGVVAATAAGQYALRLTALQERDDVIIQHASAKTTADLHDRLQLQLAEVEATADLYAYLSHPWPRTQIIAALHEPLPQQIVLTQLNIRRENNSWQESGVVGRRSPVRQNEEDKESESLRPAERDLHSLRSENDANSTVITVSGYTTDTPALHRYVQQLGRSSLLARAELRSFEAADERIQAGASTFEVRAIVRPGYGQPGAPSGSAEQVDLLTSAVTQSQKK